MVNVAALPDKGERLKSQVKQLEEALEALSLTSVGLTGEILLLPLAIILLIFKKLF